MSEHQANQALANTQTNSELLAERKPLEFTTQAPTLGDVNNSATWELV